MKLPSYKWRVRWSDDSVFYGYRWVAWALAGLSLTLPGRTVASLPRDAGVLLLLGVITVALTAMAQSYVRLVRRRPEVIILDVLAGLVVVWLSGGGALPFLPYALGALVLPALLGGWVEVVGATVAFALCDIAAMLAIALLSGGAINLGELGLRVAAPLAFVCSWVLIRRLPGRSAHPDPLAVPRAGAAGERRAAGAADGDQALRLSSFADLPRDANVRAGGLASAQRAPSQLAPAPRAEAARHAIFDPTPGEILLLPAAIDQMLLNFVRQGGVELRLITLGGGRPLSGAQHSVLLRAAYEAVQNVYQHSHAHSALITLSFEPQAVTLAVQDDGVGLLDGTYERPGMHALRAVRYRLAELEGQLAVFESESGGVTLRATLPLDG